MSLFKHILEETRDRFIRVALWLVAAVVFIALAIVAYFQP